MNTMADKCTDIFEYKNNFEKYKTKLSKLIYGGEKSKKTPYITVCVPVYKPEFELFKRTLQSLKAQDCSVDFEILIVNNEHVDISEDKIYETIIKLNIKNVLYYANEENIGMIQNWNRCVELARSNLITFCHADDELKTDCISRLIELHANNPDCMIASAWDTIDENDNYVSKHNCKGDRLFFHKRTSYRLDLFDLFHGGVGFGVGCLFEKDKLIRIGGFCPDYYPSADYALFIKYCYQYGLLFNEIPTFNYRKAVNESFNQWKNFLSRDSFFRKCMTPKIRLPDWFLSVYSASLYKYHSEMFAKFWTKDASSIKKCNFLIKIFVKMVLKITHLRKYRFSLWK